MARSTSVTGIAIWPIFSIRMSLLRVDAQHCVDPQPALAVDERVHFLPMLQHLGRRVVRDRVVLPSEDLEVEPAAAIELMSALDELQPRERRPMLVDDV